MNNNTLRGQIGPLLEEFKKATGKGNMIVANNTLLKVIDVLVDHIEMHTHSTFNSTFTDFNYNYAAAAPAPNAANYYSGWPPFNVGVPLQGWNVLQPTLQDAENITGTMINPEGKVVNYYIERDAAEELMETKGINVEQELINGVIAAETEHQNASQETVSGDKVKAKPGRKPKPKAAAPAIKRGRGRPRKNPI